MGPVYPTSQRGRKRSSDPITSWSEQPGGHPGTSSWDFTARAAAGGIQQEWTNGALLCAMLKRQGVSGPPSLSRHPALAGQGSWCTHRQDIRTSRLCATPAGPCPGCLAVSGILHLDPRPLRLAQTPGQAAKPGLASPSRSCLPLLLLFLLCLGPTLSFSF